MNIRKSLKQGFTLVELMIVVAIVGVLAVLAVYGVRKYIANAKTAEAKNSLGQIGKDAVTAFEGESMAPAVLATQSSTGIIRQMCNNASKPVPPGGAASVTGKKYQSSKGDWTAAGVDVTTLAGFPCLRFEMTAPQYYAYNYTVTAQTGEGAAFAAVANGDLNGDGVFSTFTQNGAIAEGRLLLGPSIGENKAEE